MAKTRHEELVGAGWRYDAKEDRYAAPGSPTDGTARLYNLDAAWARFLQQQTDEATPTSPTRAKDPREQEPQ